jgi:SAM-dependent methyltransferase
METDPERKGYLRLQSELADWAQSRRVLEVGYGYGGRTFSNAKVLDLYDTRPDVDYRLDACRMEGIANASFDLIQCNSVLEHIPRFWEAAAEMERVLAPGGYLWCSVPWVWSFHAHGMNGDNFGGDYWRISHQGMVSLFGKCEPIAVWYIGPAACDYEGAGWGTVYVGRRKDE